MLTICHVQQEGSRLSYEEMVWVSIHNDKGTCSHRNESAKIGVLMNLNRCVKVTFQEKVVTSANSFWVQFISLYI